MKKHSLSPKGLSLSQAQSISNLCNQRSRDIGAALSGINNVSKQLIVDGVQYIETAGKPIPANVVELLSEKARLHATQAFLMENIKAKDYLIKELQRKTFSYDIPAPTRPDFEDSDSELNLADEDWGWSQLSTAEINEFLEAEAFAAHIGQFIHKDGTLDNLRNQLPKLKTLEWIEIEKDKKTPLQVTIHHTPEQLLALHEELAALHRKYEQRVNYFKANVKNAVTIENAKRSKERHNQLTVINEKNSLLHDEYVKQLEKYRAESKSASVKFEEDRQNQIAEIASMRISIDARFQSVIDEFLSQLQ
jgi:hypothetical protein